MALANYTDLQAAIVNWAMRSGDSDFTAQVPDFITMAEARLNSRLRCAEMQSTATIALTNGAGSFPADYLQWTAVLDGSSPPRPLTLANLDYAFETYGSSTAGYADVFTISGTTITTFPASSTNLALAYYAKIPALSASNTTNWLLNKSPQLYLYGALIEAAPYMMDDARATTWGTLFEKAVQDLENADKHARFAHVTARVRGATP